MYTTACAQKPSRYEHPTSAPTVLLYMSMDAHTNNNKCDPEASGRYSNQHALNDRCYHGTLLQPMPTNPCTPLPPQLVVNCAITPLTSNSDLLDRPLVWNPKSEGNWWWPSGPSECDAKRSVPMESACGYEQNQETQCASRGLLSTNQANTTPARATGTQAQQRQHHGLKLAPPPPSLSPPALPTPCAHLICVSRAPEISAIVW